MNITTLLTAVILLFLIPTTRIVKREPSPYTLARAEHIAKVGKLPPDKHGFYKDVDECKRQLRIVDNYLDTIHDNIKRVQRVDEDIEKAMADKEEVGFAKKKLIDLSIRGLMKERKKEYEHYDSTLPRDVGRIREHIDEFRDKCMK